MDKSQYQPVPTAPDQAEDDAAALGRGPSSPSQSSSAAPTTGNGGPNLFSWSTKNSDLTVEDYLGPNPQFSPQPHVHGIRIQQVGNKQVLQESDGDSVKQSWPASRANSASNSIPELSLDSLEIDDSYPVSEGDFDEVPIGDNQATGSLKSAFFNMTNSIVGAGIVGIPRAIKNCGLVTGIITLILLAFLNDWTLRLIILNTKLSGARTYTGFVTANFGRWGKIIVLLSQGLFAFGGSVGFAVIIGDTIPHVLRSLFADAISSSKFVDTLLSRNVLIVCSVCFVAYPLCLNRDISKLAKASGLAIISMLIIIVLVVIRAPMMDATLRGTISGSDWTFHDTLFKGISVISFAMVCHHNTTFIYDSIKKPTLDRFDAITHLSCIISTILCMIMGLVGYLNFGSLTKGNILNNFPGSDWVINIARFCFGLNMLTTFPLEIYVVREVVKDLLEIYYQSKKQDPGYRLERLNTTQFVGVTTIICFIPMLISLFTCNLGAVLELVGATSASMIAYILPPLCYDKMTKRGKTVWQRLPSFLCIIFGFMVMFISSTQTIIDSINGKEGGHCVE